MKIKIQLVIEGGNDSQSIVKDVTCLERSSTLSPGTLGLTLEEGKKITAEIQQKMIAHQVNDFTSKHRFCPHCGTSRHIKGYNPLMYMSVFGKVCLKNPRIETCQCTPQIHASFSPLCPVLKEHISPELSYLEAKWASLMSYGLTTKLLEEVLPMETDESSIRANLQGVSKRLEGELSEEKPSFIEGCPIEWEKLPRPDPPITVSLDGGYIHAREGKNRKAGWIEAIVGKGIQEGKFPKRFGYIVSYEEKPKRKLYEMLKSQNLQENQDVIFITDGGNNVRELPVYLNPCSEHITDWFHITMKITVMGQMAKGILEKDLEEFEKKLESIKWSLWHGNTIKALEKLEFLDLDLAECAEDKTHKKHKLWKAVGEFYDYIRANKAFIVNYSERYNHGESISSSIAESAVNEVISRRMAKKQQMRWTKEGAHHLLQVRIKALNNDLKDSFKKWYPTMEENYVNSQPIAA